MPRGGFFEGKLRRLREKPHLTFSLSEVLNSTDYVNTHEYDDTTAGTHPNDQSDPFDGSHVIENDQLDPLDGSRVTTNDQSDLWSNGHSVENKHTMHGSENTNVKEARDTFHDLENHSNNVFSDNKGDITPKPSENSTITGNEYVQRDVTSGKLGNEHQHSNVEDNGGNPGTHYKDTDPFYPYPDFYQYGGEEQIGLHPNTDGIHVNINTNASDSNSSFVTDILSGYATGLIGASDLWDSIVDKYRNPTKQEQRPADVTHSEGHETQRGGVYRCNLIVHIMHIFVKGCDIHEHCKVLHEKS